MAKDTFLYAYHTNDELRYATDDRRKMLLSDRDYERFQQIDKWSREHSGWFAVTDLLTGDELMIRWANCGLDCYCAAEWATVSELHHTNRY